MKKLAVFASGNGSNFTAIVEAVKAGIIQATIDCLICDRKEAYVFTRAKEAGVEAFYFNIKAYDSKNDYEQAIVAVLKEKGIDGIVLAGYMKIIGETLLKHYPNKIVNIHPSLLPDFPGKQGILDAFQAGVDKTGVTVHIVDAGVDTGPILAQQSVEILKEDTLESLKKKIHQIEHDLYSKTIQNFLQNL